jgi:Zn2+/Cd2+-exporting ATPase
MKGAALTRWTVLAGTAFLLNGVALVHGSSQAALGEFAAAIGAGLLALPLVARACASMRSTERRMDELVALAVLACLALADYTTAGIVALLMLGASALERHTASGAWTEIESLLRLAPKHARRCRPDGSWEEIPAHELAAGDTIDILPGDTVPADGTILEGASALAEATITGESLPADKAAGDPVFAGTLNVTGALRVTVTKAGDDTTLARVRRMILGARETRPAAAGIFERYAGWYPPVVVMTAGLVLFLSDDWTRAISTIVAACPIALVIAIPSATVAALACAYRSGMVVKNPRALDIAADTSAVVVDKTGTLTCGELRVVSVLPRDGWREEDVLGPAAAVARYSLHPVARALVDAARARGLALESATDVREEPGRGLARSVGGRAVRLGRPEYLAAAGIPLGGAEAEQEAMRGYSAIAVAVGDRGAGFIALEDRPRPESSRVVAELREFGVDRVLMVTGDRREVAERTARELGIDEVVAQCLPDQKRELVLELRRGGERVLVVGDGVNDAPALASGDLGVALGTGGSDIALESADVAIVRGDLRSVGLLLRLSRRSRAVTAQNLIIGVALIVTGVLLAGLGYVNPIAAAVLQNAGALAVLFSSARLVGGEVHGDRP